MRIKARVKTIVRSFVGRAIAFINDHPGLRSICVKLVKKIGLYNRLRPVYLRYLPNTPVGAQSGDAVPRNPQDLTSHARRIYADLKDAIAKQQKKND